MPKKDPVVYVPIDPDLHALTREDLTDYTMALRDAIRYHRDRGKDRIISDDLKLYSLLPENGKKIMISGEPEGKYERSRVKRKDSPSV